MIELNSDLLDEIFEWDVANWSKAIEYWEIKNLNLNDKKVLAVGERNGGLTLLFALLGATVYCTDLNGPTEEAREKHNKYNLHKKIIYASEDVTQLSFEDSKFDYVVFKSVLGGLRLKELQIKAINEIDRVLKNDGRLLFAENFRGSLFHGVSRRIFIKWGSYWRYLSYKDMHSFFTKFNSLKFNYYGFFSAFGRSEKQRNILSAIDKKMMKIIPNSSRYIVFGNCVKK